MGALPEYLRPPIEEVAAKISRLDARLTSLFWHDIHNDCTCIKERFDGGEFIYLSAQGPVMASGSVASIPLLPQISSADLKSLLMAGLRQAKTWQGFGDNWKSSYRKFIPDPDLDLPREQYLLAPPECFGVIAAAPNGIGAMLMRDGIRRLEIENWRE